MKEGLHYILKQDTRNNPFPTIRVYTKIPHEAWLQVVYTDSKDSKLQQFVDAADPSRYSHIYPFYTLEKDFQNTPQWRTSFLFPPIHFWKGHVYAVKVDPIRKVIRPVGGIEWGFTLSRFSFFPDTTTPLRRLKEEDWKRDKAVLVPVCKGWTLAEP